MKNHRSLLCNLVFPLFFLGNMDIEDILDMIDVDEDSEDEENTMGLISYLHNNKELTSVPCLKTLSVKSLAQNIKYWMSYIPPNSIECMYFINPFDSLRTTDTLAVLKILVDAKIFRTEHFQLLFHYQLVSMDFSLVKTGVNDHALRCLFTRCKRIKDLTIPCSRLSLKVLNQIPVVYPGMEYLRIYREVCHAQFLQLIAKCCKKLKLLLIKECVNFPDSAFESLKECISLNSLTLYHAENMTCSTFQKITAPLKNLNQLSLVGCKMNFASFNENSIEYDRLASLDLSWSNVTDYGLKQVVSHMRNLAELYLCRCQNLTTAAFKCIADLDHLSRLTIGYFMRNYEFDTNVELCLLRIGMNLTYLDLPGMPRVQPNVIAMCCPNLKTLHLNHCVYPQIDWIRLNNENSERTQSNWLSNTKGLFTLLGVTRCLEQLSISCMHLSFDDVRKLFFNSSSLRKLKFLPWPSDSSKYVSEQFFMDFFNDFHFDHLEELDVSRNGGLTKKVVLLVLKLYPRLKRLSISGCGLVAQELSVVRDIVVTAGLETVIEVTYQKNVVTFL